MIARLHSRFRLLFPAAALAGLLWGWPATATVPSTYAKQRSEWFAGEEGRRIADHVLTWQSSRGSWPKNGDTASQPFAGRREELKGTFDNGATTGELRFLANAFAATNEPRYRDAFEKGLDHVLAAQYPTGGWPQSFPPGDGYHRQITFNDHSMVRILELLRDVGQSQDFAFVDDGRGEAARSAFERGVRCILDCQIVVDGKLTVWCAQHDEVDLRPRPARAFELMSLSGAESASILELLMSLNEPDEPTKRAIVAGVEWFESSKLPGIRVERSETDVVVVVEDSTAPPLWARFYEIETNRPFFCGRDGIKKYRLSEIEAERRTGYAWYGDWGRDVAESYADWKKRPGR